MGSETILFVGAHFEIKNGSEITKYYYAGGQRIAMRKNGTLTYMLTDHLGSTSLITNTSGAVISELRYGPCPSRVLREGNVRYQGGTMSTPYQYTGQYSYQSDFGLYFYRAASRAVFWRVDNARWYDNSLGRFVQADTIVPGGAQGLDRYAYSNNSPVVYNDPSGHWFETALDIASIAYDIYDISSNGLNWVSGDGIFSKKRGNVPTHAPRAVR